MDSEHFYKKYATILLTSFPGLWSHPLFSQQTKYKTFIHQDVGFHLRDGGHYIADYDWHRFIDFANYHFKK